MYASEVVLTEEWCSSQGDNCITSLEYMTDFPLQPLVKFSGYGNFSELSNRYLIEGTTL